MIYISSKVTGLLLLTLCSVCSGFFNYLKYRTNKVHKCYVSTNLKAFDGLEDFTCVLNRINSNIDNKNEIMQQIKLVGWRTSEDLYHFAIDFADRPELLSTLLKDDFGFNPLQAHQVRAAMMDMIKSRTSSTIEQKIDIHNGLDTKDISVVNNIDSASIKLLSSPSSSSSSSSSPQIPLTTNIINTNTNSNSMNMDEKKEDKPSFKKVIVNSHAKALRSNKKGTTTINYGLPNDYEVKYPILGDEIIQFKKFMIEPNTLSQDDPIRPATADVYIRHAKLFLGWYLITHETSLKKKNKSKKNGINYSLKDVFPTKKKESMDSVLQFVQWLRQERSSSVSYEANMLRGLTKLAKFRFAKESKSEPSYGEKSYEDIPMIREMRRLHRDANRRQSVAPRSSDEKLKWLTWPEYLSVVESVKKELQIAIKTHDKRYGPESGWAEKVNSQKLRRKRSPNGKRKEKFNKAPPLKLDWKKRVRSGSDNYHFQDDEIDISEGKRPFMEINSNIQNEINDNNGKECDQVEREEKDDPSKVSLRTVARLYQSYLLLAFFACIPDRQRTFRELTLGSTLVKEDGVWLVRHGPNDYKTGKSYGARPPLMITPELVPAIDNFIDKYRPSLRPNGDHFFAQVRTGNALTQDSVYQIVARSCFQYTGKKTNPHLLRDMIVTHVRESDASEKELEALALYMGHSINMQRSSYDRRTLQQKVAPAVSLLQKVNKESSS